MGIFSSKFDGQTVINHEGHVVDDDSTDMDPPAEICNKSSDNNNDDEYGGQEEPIPIMIPGTNKQAKKTRQIENTTAPLKDRVSHIESLLEKEQLAMALNWKKLDEITNESGLPKSPEYKLTYGMLINKIQSQEMYAQKLLTVHKVDTTMLGILSSSMHVADNATENTKVAGLINKIKLELTAVNDKNDELVDHVDDLMAELNNYNSSANSVNTITQEQHNNSNEETKDSMTEMQTKILEYKKVKHTSIVQGPQPIAVPTLNVVSSVDQDGDHKRGGLAPGLTTGYNMVPKVRVVKNGNSEVKMQSPPVQHSNINLIPAPYNPSTRESNQSIAAASQKSVKNQFKLEQNI